MSEVLNTKTVNITKPVITGQVDVSLIKKLSVFVYSKSKEAAKRQFEEHVSLVLKSNEEHNKKTIFFKRTTDIEVIKKDSEVKRRIIERHSDVFIKPFLHLSEKVLLNNQSLDISELADFLTFVEHYGYHESTDFLIKKILTKNKSVEIVNV